MTPKIIWTRSKASGRSRLRSIALFLIWGSLLVVVPARAAYAAQEGTLVTGAPPPDVTTMEKACAWFEEDKDFIEGLKTTTDAIEFVERSAEKLSKLAWMVPSKVAGDAVSWILTRGVTRIEIVGTQPDDGVVHYQHRWDLNNPEEQYADVAVRVYAEFKYQDPFVGCMKALGVEIPKSGAMKDVWVTFDMKQLKSHFTMTKDHGVHSAAWGAPGGDWENRTDANGVAQFKLQTHIEAPPNGQGSVMQDRKPFTVTANPHDVKNVLAAILNLLDVGLVQDQGTLTAEWHTGPTPVGIWHGTVTVVWNVSLPDGGSGHSEVTYTIPKALSGGTYKASASFTSVLHVGSCTTTATFGGSGSGIQSAAASLAQEGTLTILWHPVNVPVAGTVKGTGPITDCQGTAPINDSFPIGGGEAKVKADPHATSLESSTTLPGAFTTVTWNLVKD